MKNWSATKRYLAAWATLTILVACSGAGTPPGVPLASRSTIGHQPVSPPVRSSLYYGCPVFGTSNGYNSVITNAPVDQNSAAYISSVIQAGDTYGFYASTGVEQVNLANNDTPLLTVHPKVKYHQFPVPYPWSSGFFIEPLSDGHAMVVQTQTCHLYESYGTTFQNPTLSAYSGANWNMKRRFVPLAPGTPSATASGLPFFAGLVRWEDYQSGSIDHAINWDAIAHTVAAYQFVRPASDTDQLPFYGSSSYQLPYGARLRLRASFSTSGWGPQATMIANAMKTYGIYLADTGSNGNGLYLSNAADGTNPWDSHDLYSLNQITIGDFDVIKLGKVQTVPGH